MVRFEVTWSLIIFHGAHFPWDESSPISLHFIDRLVSPRAILSGDEISNELSREVIL